ncbi:hypothetical protein H0H87_011253, partial [Tephrocybe sp. NHM501043]
MAQALPHDLTNRTTAVMDYALKSQNYELMDKAAPLLIDEKPSTILQLFKESDRILAL